MKELLKNDRSGRNVAGVNRLANLVDGVFAIAMTLLVLNIDVPVLPKPFSSEALWRQLSGKSSVFFSYLLSFYILGALWVANVMQLRLLERTKSLHIWLNLLVLMLVGLVPFSTDLVGQYPDLAVAQDVFHLNMLAVGLAYLMVSRVGSGDVSMLMPGLDPGHLARRRRLGFLLPGAALAGLGMVFVAPGYSTLCYACIPLARHVIWRGDDEMMEGE